MAKIQGIATGKKKGAGATLSLTLHNIFANLKRLCNVSIHRLIRRFNLFIGG